MMQNVIADHLMTDARPPLFPELRLAALLGYFIPVYILGTIFMVLNISLISPGHLSQLCSLLVSFAHFLTGRA